MVDPSPPSSSSDSLERTKPDLPMEWREGSYLGELRRYADSETRAYLRRDLPIEIMGASLYGILQGGWTVAAMWHGFLGFLMFFVAAYFIHFLNAPSELDKRRREQIRAAHALLENVENKRPEIVGEIKAVYEDFPSSSFGFDYIFTINVYLKNKGEAVGVRDYKLRLIQGAHVYLAEKVSLRSYYLERQESHPTGRYGELGETDAGYALTDLEDMRNEPLTQVGRDGWLRFVVQGVQWKDEYEEDKQTRIPKTLELTVVDGDGTEHKIVSSEPWEVAGRIRKYANAR